MNVNTKLNEIRDKSSRNKKELIDLLVEIRNDVNFVIGVISLTKDEEDVFEVLNFVKTDSPKYPPDILEFAFLHNYEKYKLNN
jgi:hypothetical protein